MEVMSKGAISLHRQSACNRYGVVTVGYPKAVFPIGFFCLWLVGCGTDTFQIEKKGLRLIRHVLAR